MASILKKGPSIPLNFASGTILILKSTVFPSARPTSGLRPIYLDVFNENGDTLLNITFSQHHEISCRDRARKSLGDGWGKAQKVDNSYVDIDRWRESGVTFSVHHYFTDSKFGRYQILLGKTTICYLDTRFPGRATQIAYSGDMNLGPDSWRVSVYPISDLQPDERRLLESGR
jgi:hypothetical protein